MEHISLVMVRPDLWRLPQFALPDGYWIRTFRLGDEWAWAKVEWAAAEFNTPSMARDHFAHEFGAKLSETGRRCHFLVAEDGQIVGTASAWFGSRIDGQIIGRLHWVAIMPDYQGKGLAKPLVGAAMTRMAALHDRGYLTTQTTSFKAVKIYLDFGFVPHVETEQQSIGWRMMADLLGHDRLVSFR